MADPIELLIQGRAHDLGGGFAVRRVLPSAKRRMVGPFIFLDHFGPMDVPPGGGMEVRPHPHIGLATVTYLFEGGIFHRDSLGYAQAIRPGDVNWMTAGSGIAHSERREPEMRATGFRMHGSRPAALPRPRGDGAGLEHVGRKLRPGARAGRRSG
jgi:redox-sensitive bicupin YhaK (pirin superfamily)